MSNSTAHADLKTPYVPGFSGQLSNRANYPGDVADAVMRQQELFGPDMFGAYYTPVSATYERDADVTRVQFQPVPRSKRVLDESLLDAGSSPLTRQQRRQLEREQRKQAARNGRRR